MAAIRISVIGHETPGGPDVLIPHGAHVDNRLWPDGCTTTILVLSFGRDTVEIWPFDREQTRSLGQQLIKLSSESPS